MRHTKQHWHSGCATAGVAPTHLLSCVALACNPPSSAAVRLLGYIHHYVSLGLLLQACSTVLSRTECVQLEGAWLTSRCAGVWVLRRLCVLVHCRNLDQKAQETDRVKERMLKAEGCV